MYALDASSGPDAELNPDRERWKIETKDEVWSSPAVLNGTVYIGSKDNRIYAFTGDTSSSTATTAATETADEPNEPPTASITVTTSKPTPGESITFDASESTDPDGSVTSYEWEIRVTAGAGGGGRSNSGPTAETSIPSNAESVAAELTVTDDDGATDTTTRRIEFDGGSTEDSGPSVLPLLVGAGTVGAVGGSVWWYMRRDGTDTKTGARKSGGDSIGGTSGSISTTTASSNGSTGGTSGSNSDSSHEQTSTAMSGATRTASKSDTESSADSGLPETVDKSLDKGDAFLDKASNHRDTGEYNRALNTYDKAQKAYEDAFETASQSTLIDTDEIEQKLAAVQDQRQETHRQQLQDEVESVRSDLDSREELADDDALGKAQERLTNLESVLSSAKESAVQHDFDNLQKEIATLEQRRKVRLREITEQLRHPVPDEIPHVPDVSVDYDALTDEEPIGGGGNADVSKAILPASDGDVTLAIKRPRMAGTIHTEAVERMLDEAETWDKLDNHDYIVGVVDYGSEPLPWIAMEYMNGGHLGEKSGEMEIPQALWTALVVTKAVRHAHRRGVAHLDLKPENVLLRVVEDAWNVPKVADWGLSKHLLDHSKSVEGMSVKYAAPEQFDDDYGSVDDQTDIYQLGAVFYELFTGRPPFEGQPFKVIESIKTDRPRPPSEIADVPEALDEILLTALAKEKDDRYDDIVYLRGDFKKLFDNW